MNATSSSADHAPQRDARIDLLRGVAILLVMLLHFSLTYRLSQSPLAAWLSVPVVQALIVNGNYGVTMFFAISGFLITSYSLRRAGSLGAIDVRQFYVYRFARIMPTLALALGAIVTLGFAGVPSFANSSHHQPLPASFFAIAVFSVLTFWHNVLMQSLGYFNYCLNIYWSLSVEEVFYLVYPLAAIALRRSRWFVAACAVPIVVAPIYRALHADNELYFMYGYAACFDAIAMGCIVALCKPHLRLAPRLRGSVAIAAGLALCWTYAIGIDGHEALGFSAIALSTSLLLLTAPGAGERSAAAARGLAPLRWLGRHSYELYLFHIVVLAGMRDLLPRDALAAGLKLPWLVLFFALSAGAAAAISRSFSEPVNRWLRERLARRTAAPVAA